MNFKVVADFSSSDIIYVLDSFLDICMLCIWFCDLFVDYIWAKFMALLGLLIYHLLPRTSLRFC